MIRIDKNVEAKTIRSQNNTQELERESKRLEKLFYYYRDLEDEVKKNASLDQLIEIRMNNAILLEEIFTRVDTKDSKFLKRIDHMWNKFITS